MRNSLPKNEKYHNYNLNQIIFPFDNIMNKKLKT